MPDQSEEFQWATSAIGMLNPFGAGPSLRRSQEFVDFAQASLDGKTYEEAKSVFSASKHQAETRKSMLEEMGLAYVLYGSQEIRVTPVGKQLYDLLKDGSYTTNAPQAKRVRAVMGWALANCQLNRPQSRGTPRPSEEQWRTSDVKPYATAWRAIADLGGHLTMDEFFLALSSIHRADEYEAALEKVRISRAGAHQIIDSTRYMRGGDLFNPRIYWKSHLAGGGALLETEAGVLKFRPETADAIVSAVDFTGDCADSFARGNIKARPYSSAEEYFETVGGRPCPEFLASGVIRVVSVADEPIAVLEGYDASTEGQYIVVDGGAELCGLALDKPVYHSSQSKRLLRLHSKTQLQNGGVRLRLAKGRPLLQPLTN